MKHSIFIFISLLLVFTVSGQGIKQEVISSAGGYNVNGGLSISWTLGETIIPTFKSADNTLILSHGFQQQLIISTVEETIDVLVEVSVFPNPAREIVNIRFDTPLDGEIKLFLFDSQGRLVKTDIIEPASSDKQINLQDLAAGIYYLKLTKSKLANVYKVVKL